MHLIVGFSLVVHHIHYAELSIDYRAINMYVSSMNIEQSFYMLMMMDNIAKWWDIHRFIMVSYVLCSHINTVEMILCELLHAPTIHTNPMAHTLTVHVLCVWCVRNDRSVLYMDCGKVCVRWCVYLSKWVAELVNVKVFRHEFMNRKSRPITKSCNVMISHAYAAFYGVRLFI